MIKRVYYVMCDGCGSVLRDRGQHTEYHDQLQVMINLVKKAGWKTVDINDPKKKLDYCERCKDVDLDSK
jgi:hypothetical protein